MEQELPPIPKGFKIVEDKLPPIPKGFSPVDLKKKEPTTKDLQSGSTISTKPFDVFQNKENQKNIFGGKTLPEFIGKEKAENIEREVAGKGVNLKFGKQKENTNTPSLTNTSGFLEDIGANLSGNRYSAISKDLSEKLTNINKAYSNQPVLEKLTKAPLKEEKLYQGVEDNERVGNRAVFLYNELLDGLGGLASGLGDLGSQLIYSGGVGQTRDRFQQALPVTQQQKEFQDEQIKEYRENIAPEIRGYLKDKIGGELDKTLENKYRNETITGALGGLAKSSPSVALTVYSGGLGSGAMFLQTFDDSLQSINSTEEGKNLDEATKTYFATGVGMVGSALEKFGLDRIFKGETGVVSNLIAKKALQNASKETGGKVTGDVFTKFLDKEIFNLSNKFIKGGAKAVDSYLTEYATGGAQEISTIGAEFLTNKLTGKPVFDTSETSTWNGFLSRVNKAANLEGIGGGMLGLVSGLASIPKKDIETKQKSIEEINKSLDKENISPAVEDVLIQNKIKLQKEIDDISNNVNENYQKLTDEQKTKVKEIAEAKMQLESELKKEDLPNDIKTQLQEKLNELDTELSGLSELAKEQKLTEEDTTPKGITPIELEQELSNVNSEIDLLEKEIEPISERYNELVNIVNSQDRRLNQPLTKEEIELKDVQSKMFDLIDRRNKLQQQTDAIQESSTTEEVSRTGETGKVITESGEGVRPSEQGQEVTQEGKQKEVERLRAKEQAEYSAMENPKDKAERQKIYDKYDKLITPLLEQGKTEVKLPELKDDSLDLAIEVANDISELKQKQSRAKSKASKEMLANKISESESELKDIPVEAKIAKGINDNFDKIKKELKDKNLIEIKGC